MIQSQSEKEVLYNQVKVEVYNQAKAVLRKAANQMTEAYNPAKEVSQIY